jgi:hypothetical protein
LIFSILVYFGAWFYGKCTDPIPALAGLVLLLTLLCWLLSGITFMFDRFRVPLLLILAIALSYSGIWPEADHTFATKPDAVSLPAPQAIVAGRDRFIVVAASGGGLHASAWTARVLGGLYLELPKDLRKTFANSIRVISPVSGGSLGTIYFVNAYQLDGFGTGDFSAEMMDTNVYQPSQASSLNRIAEKLVFEDVWRTLLPPIPLTADRGRAAEEAWVSAIKDPNSQMRLRQPLKDWASFATGSAKPTPAVLINATLSDTGERVVLGTSGFGPARRPGRRLFHDLYNRKIDIPLVTAARLSATFPFVSPSARAEGEWAKQERYHFVDGGYYDNYGVSTLVEWLDDALTGAPAFQRVLMIQIRDSKVPVGDAPAKGESGFWAQTVSPLNTLLRFRDAGQLGHGTLETELLGPRSGVEPVMFAWPDDNAPLSWHLTKQEQNRIAAAFDEEGFKAAKRKVCLFLAGDDLKLRQECETSFGAPSATN